MAKVKKMADGGITGLGQMMAGAVDPGYGFNPTSGGGGGTAQDGLNQINDGTKTVGSAVSTAQSALGGGGNSGGGASNYGFTEPTQIEKKRGGSIKKHASGGKINLKDCKVSTHEKNSKNKHNW